MKKIIIAIVVMILISATALGAIYFKKIYSGSGNIGGGSTEFKTEEKSSQEYLELIDQYTKEINDLKVKLAEITTKYDTDITAKQSQIIDLQKELLELKQTDEALINEKNAKIAELEAQIVTLQNEKEEASKKDKEQIEQLETKVNELQIAVLKTCEVGSFFPAENYRLTVIDDSSFILTESREEGQSYYYNIKTNKTFVIDTYYVYDFLLVDTELYCRGDDNKFCILNLETGECQVLSELSCIGSHNVFVRDFFDDNNVYIFIGDLQYFVIDRTTHKVTTNVDTSSFSFSFKISCSFVEDIGNGFIYLTNTDSSCEAYLFSKSSFTFSKFTFDVELSNYMTYISGYYGSCTYTDKNGEKISLICFSHVLYSVDFENMTLNYLKTFDRDDFIVQNEKIFYILSNCIAIFPGKGCFTYSKIDGQIVFNDLSSKVDIGFVNYVFEVQPDTYIIHCPRAGLYYFNTMTSECFCLVTYSSTSYNLLQNLYKVESGKYVCITYDYYIILDDSGKLVESFSRQRYFVSPAIYKTEHYIIFCIATDNVLIYEKETDTFKQGFSISSNFISLGEINGYIYSLDSDRFCLYTFEDCQWEFFSCYNVDSSLSSLSKGIIYSRVGEFNNSIVYVKCCVNADKSISREFVLVEK